MLTTRDSLSLFGLGLLYFLGSGLNHEVDIIVLGFLSLLKVESVQIRAELAHPFPVSSLRLVDDTVLVESSVAVLAVVGLARIYVCL